MFFDNYLKPACLQWKFFRHSFLLLSKIAHFANSSQIFFRISFLNLCSPRVTHPKSDSDSFAGFYEMCTTKQVLNSQTFFVLAGLAKPKISVRDKTNHDTGYQAVFVNPSYLLQLNGTFDLSALFFGKKLTNQLQPTLVTVIKKI